ncbi:MAG: hypothetical protein C4K60_11815 [Ideonella sp. MAG2]|nr:MAG: hypothetical protein C4K60_11815 [Ideonella sp. MAG2]
MAKHLIDKVADKAVTDRDLLVDELADMIEGGSLLASDIVEVVNRLVNILGSEDDPAVMESIFNLLGSAFDRIGMQEDALLMIVSLLDRLQSGCLVHAIPLVGRSNFQNRRQLIAPFLNSPNIAVRQVAEIYSGSNNDES